MILYQCDRQASPKPAPRKPAVTPLQGGWLRAVLLALLWWILTDGALDSWLVGAPVVLLATWVSVALLPPSPCSLSGVVRFIPFFLWCSLCGGVDVARRALHPQLPISPGSFDLQWRLPPGLPRLFMANTISLLPGTLSAEFGVDCLQVHLLDERKDFLPELERVEQRVAAIFGISLPPSRGAG